MWLHCEPISNLWYEQNESFSFENYTDKKMFIN